jgi:phage N-6-adenine-methyltransferase
VYARLHDEFRFAMDVAARSDNAKCDAWLGPDQPNPFWRDACSCPSWLALSPGPFWMNPPYSQADAFMRKAAVEAAAGATVVALVPSRTDTRWWHRHVWDATRHRPRPGVEVRFLSGRVKFGDGKDNAPFPSVVIVFRPPALQIE